MLTILGVYIALVLGTVIGMVVAAWLCKSREQHLDARLAETQTALDKATRELIAERDQYYDGVTTRDGAFLDTQDQAEVLRLDALIDHCQRARGIAPNNTWMPRGTSNTC